MKVYQTKAIRCGFVIIGRTAEQARVTAESVRSNYPASPCVCCLPELFKGAKLPCEVRTGGTSETALANLGLRQPPCDGWNFLVAGGAWVRPELDRRFAYFLDGEQDVLYPVVHRKANFCDLPFNGILLHKKNFEAGRPFPERGRPDLCKLIWSLEAQARGCRFKGVVGLFVSSNSRPARAGHK